MPKKTNLAKQATIIQPSDRLSFERALWEQGITRVMGLDEAGRGCLAGPVVAAGVILHPDSQVPENLRDSKQLPEAERDELAIWVRANAVYWHVARVEPVEIDRINILKASLKAMLICVEQSEAQAQHLLVDGNRFTTCLIPHTCLIKGDDRSASIAAASILAKTERDKIMRQYHLEYPMYGWDSNVGYPTAAHFKGLADYGICPLHRRSFRLRAQKALEATPGTDTPPITPLTGVDAQLSVMMPHVQADGEHQGIYQE